MQIFYIRRVSMKHIETIKTVDLKKSAVYGGCGECQASCQTASKDTNTVTNQECENNK